MMTFTYILLWVLIGLNAIMIITGRKQNKVMKEQMDYADRLQKSADSLYDSAMKVLVEEKPKLIAYDNIRKTLTKRSGAMQTNLHLITDINKDSIEAIINSVDAAEQMKKDKEHEQTN